MGQDNPPEVPGGLPNAVLAIALGVARETKTPLDTVLEWTLERFAAVFDCIAYQAAVMRASFDDAKKPAGERPRWHPAFSGR